jgi:hypothetical protein
MNHIRRLTADRDDARATIEETRDELNDLLAYLDLAKFAPPDGDYIHVRTDLMPKLLKLRQTLCV